MVRERDGESEPKHGQWSSWTISAPGDALLSWEPQKQTLGLGDMQKGQREEHVLVFCPATGVVCPLTCSVLGCSCALGSGLAAGDGVPGFAFLVCFAFEDSVRQSALMSPQGLCFDLENKNLFLNCNIAGAYLWIQWKMMTIYLFIYFLPLPAVGNTSYPLRKTTSSPRFQPVCGESFPCWLREQLPIAAGCGRSLINTERLGL